MADPYEMARLIVESPIWRRECMRSVPLFRELPNGALQELENNMQVAKFGVGESVVRKGERAPGIFFVVNGALQAGNEEVGMGGHCCAESVMALVHHFAAGLNPASALTTLSADNHTAIKSSICLLITVEDLSKNVPMMRTLAEASILIDEYSDDDEIESPRSRGRSGSGGSGSSSDPVRQSSLEDLQAQRDVLMRKIESAKLKAKKDELESMLRSMKSNRSSDGNVERERKRADENTASQLTRTPSFEKHSAGPGHQRYADLFDVIDTDRSGLITVSELRAFMRREHTYKTEEQCRNLFNLMDTNHDKSVSRREFERFRSQHPDELESMLHGVKPNRSSDGADLFDVVDTDGSGMITMNELRAFMRREHPSSTEEQCRNLFNLMDTNHDKSVSRREFERFQSQHPAGKNLTARGNSTAGGPPARNMRTRSDEDMESSSTGRSHSPAKLERAVSDPVMDSPDRLQEEKSRLEALLRVTQHKHNLVSGKKPVEMMPTMPRSFSDPVMESPDRLQEEKSRLEALLREKLHQRSVGGGVAASPVLSPTGRASPSFPQENIEEVDFLQDTKYLIHPSLHGVIPLPGTNGEVKQEQFDKHRMKWGEVWMSSHYFNHEVYRRNKPNPGVPVDTSGDGKVDSLAFDTTGDGKLDLILSDAHTEKVALEKHEVMQRSGSWEKNMDSVKSITPTRASGDAQSAKSRSFSLY